MSANLQAYLCEFSPRPFVRGVSDCCAFAAGWMERVSGRPVVCPHLGEELTDREAVAIVARIGGIAAAARAALRDAGWRQREGDPQDGDIIIVEKRETAENGESVVAMINGEQVTLKYFFVEVDGIRLQPANPSMKPIYLRHEELQILGIVSGVIRCTS